MSRYVHVCTSQGVCLPGMTKAAAAQILASQADAQLAKGRRKPVTTAVAKYVGRKAPGVARALRKVLAAWAKKVAAKVSKLYAEKLEKDDTTASARVAAIIEELNSLEMATDLQGELAGPMLAAFKRAAAVGATQVGFSVTDITDQVDTAAVAWADKRGGELIKDLAGTTEKDMQSLLSRAVDEGISVDELSDAIEGLGAFSDYRADLIARTELAFAHVQGNVEGWRASTEVVGKRWILADTHDVPDECDEAADAGVVGLDDDFVDGIAYPPAHPNCCLPGTVVAPGGRISAQFTRWFEGEVVTISTTRNDLTVTPNHPILTQRGWVAAGALEVGDHVFETADPAAASAAVDPHDHNMPARIEEVAAALLMAGGRATRGMPAPTEAFHGDGIPDGEVDVVWAAGALALEDDACGVERAADLGLGLGHRKRMSLSERSPLAALGKGSAPAAHGSMGRAGDLDAALRRASGGEQELKFGEGSYRQTMTMEQVAQGGAVAPDGGSEINRRFAGHVARMNCSDLAVVESPTKGVHVARAANADASLADQALDHLVRDGQLPGECRDRLASLVSAAQVTQLRRRKYEGPVHNISTQHGWYFANAIVTHNCLCDIIPVLREADE